MKSGKRDQAEGRFSQVKGKVKGVTGVLSDNPKLEVEGAYDRLAGKVQEKIGQIKKVFGK